MIQETVADRKAIQTTTIITICLPIMYTDIKMAQVTPVRPATEKQIKIEQKETFRRIRARRAVRMLVKQF